MGQEHSDLNIVCHTSASKDVSKQQIWDSSLKKYMRYAPKTIIVEIRSRSQNWYITLSHPKMQPHTKFGIPSSNNIEKNAPNMIILKTKSKVKVTMTSKWYMTLDHPKMHPHTKFGIPISNNIRDMLRTQWLSKLGQRSRSQWPENGTWHSAIPRCIHTSNLEFLPKRM